MRARFLARLAIAALGLLGAAQICHAGDELPSWARDAMTAPTPSDASRSPAVALLRTGSVEITGKDVFMERERRVVRILDRAGSPRAVAVAEYRTDGGKVRSLKAWIVAPSGESRQIPPKQAFDYSLAGSDMHNEARAIMLSGVADAIPGATFAWESVVERRAPFAQFEWYFQDDLPTVRSDFSIRPLPEWTVRAAMLNGDSLSAAVADGRWSWSRSGLGPLREETYSPPLSSLASRLVVGATPPAGAENGAMRSFATWEEVAAWLHELAEPSGAATPAISAKAQALTAGAATTAAKIRAIAEYCQSVNYISVQMGLSRGGGYVPHAADEVLRKGYGDCKDKSNLMRTMLRTLGIDSYLCAISASDADYVQESWPTPGQFDHCIVAARSDDSASCVVSSPALGRLVLFDPTDPSTRWGDLPESEQGGLALLVAPAGGELVRVPAAPLERGRHLRRFETTVARDGSVSGTVNIVATGTSASMWRATSRARGVAGLQSSPELWLSSAIATATVNSFTQSDPAGADSFRICASFRIPHFGRAMGGNLIILETGKFTTLGITIPSERSRTVPIMIPRFAGADELRIALPEGYGVEGVPAPETIESPFGRYSSSVRVEGSEVSIERATELHRSIVPAARSGELRAFLLKVQRALDTPLVLAKR